MIEQYHNERIELFNKFKQSMNDYNSRVLSVTGIYLGGYNDITDKPANLFVYDDRVEINITFVSKITIPLSDIKDIKVESPEEVGKRVTFTRFVALGVFSLLLKKNTKASFVVLELKDGREVIFHIKGQNQMDVKAKISSVVAKVRAT